MEVFGYICKVKILFYILFFIPFCYYQAQTVTRVQGNVRDKVNSSLMLENAGVKGIDLNGGGQFFSTSTNSVGDYFTEITGVDDDYFGPYSFSLSQNYPNPFNPSTKFNFTAPAYGDYVLLISDVLGKELFRDTYEFSAGSYVFDVSGLGSAGVKFITIAGNENAQTKKMLQLDGSSFNPSVSVSSGSSSSEFRNLSKVGDNLEMRITASKEGYLSDSVDVSYVPGGTYTQDFELRKVPVYVLDAVVKVYNMKGDVVTNLDSMRWVWPDGTIEKIPIVNGKMNLNKTFSSLNSDTSATVTPDHPDLYLNWVVGTTNNSQKVEWLYQNAEPWGSNNAIVHLNLINDKTSEQYLIPRFVKCGVNNDTPIDMTGSEVTTVLSRPPFGIVSGFRPIPYDTTYVFQFTFNTDTSVPIAQNHLDRVKNELDQVLDATVWPHKKLLNYQFHLVESFDDSIWQYVNLPPRNQDNNTYTRFRNSSAGNGVTISLDGSYRIKNSNSQYNINSTNAQMRDEIFDTFCSTNVDIPAHISALSIAGVPMTDLGKTIIGIAYILKPGTNYWNQ